MRRWMSWIWRCVGLAGIEVFNNAEFGEIRTVTVDDVVWFVASDICKALELSNPSMTVSRLDEDERAKFNLGVHDSDGTNCVNEYGLYNLVLASRKKGAKDFKRWITHEVLPSIRKHGAYMTEQTLEQALTSPDFLIKLATQLKEAQEENKALEIEKARLAVECEIMSPKADYFDELVDRGLLTSFRETAKQLGIKEKEFIKFLLEKKYIYRDKKGKLMPYAEKNNGLFEIKETFNEKTSWAGTQTLITPKGRETFRLLYIGATA